MKTIRMHTGFTLIEVLVSIVIVSFGLLGVAGLLSTGLKSTQGSLQRTQASLLAYDMADRMRMNRAAARNGEYVTDTETTNAVAISDKEAWDEAVASSLPSGAGTVTMPATNIYSITVQWDDSKVAGGSATQSFVLRGEL
ncbi:MAG: type IV pilus modification protein PilV [Propionivibrio sp.]|nr:type IV pilus modification protein PilV [Propionivibrio sp.]